MGSTKFGTNSILSKYFGTKEVLKEVCDGFTIYQKVVPPSVLGYITFSSSSSFTLSVINNTKYWDGILEYSTDTLVWSIWSGTSSISAALNNNQYKLYIRGTGNTYITGTSATTSAAYWSITGSDVSVSGNIETLLDYQTVLAGNHPTMASYCYRYLFYNDTGITSAANLVFGAATLTQYCYANMFYGCSNLASVPTSLSFTTADEYSCYTMFRGCSALTYAPSLPATTLASNCYAGMFQGCTNLVTVPNLPATTLVYQCYAYMFASCSMLYVRTGSPSSPADKPWTIPSAGNIVSSPASFNRMFYQCITSLTQGTWEPVVGTQTTFYTQNDPV